MKSKISPQTVILVGTCLLLIFFLVSSVISWNKERKVRMRESSKLQQACQTVVQNYQDNRRKHMEENWGTISMRTLPEEPPTPDYCKQTGLEQ